MFTFGWNVVKNGWFLNRSIRKIIFIHVRMFSSMFISRIPTEKIEKDEDKTIPRACLADIIENYICAVNGYSKDEINYIRVYEMEVD